MRRIAMNTSGLLVVLGMCLIGVDGVSAAEETQQANPVARHLKTFDELDFEVFSGQAWDRLH